MSASPYSLCSKCLGLMCCMSLSDVPASLFCLFLQASSEYSHSISLFLPSYSPVSRDWLRTINPHEQARQKQKMLRSQQSQKCVSNSIARSSVNTTATSQTGVGRITATFATMRLKRNHKGLVMCTCTSGDFQKPNTNHSVCFKMSLTQRTSTAME